MCFCFVFQNYDSDDCLEETSMATFDPGCQNTTQMVLAQLLSQASFNVSWIDCSQLLSAEASTNVHTCATPEKPVQIQNYTAIKSRLSPIEPSADSSMSENSLDDNDKISKNKEISSHPLQHSHSSNLITAKKSNEYKATVDRSSKTLTLNEKDTAFQNNIKRINSVIDEIVDLADSSDDSQNVNVNENPAILPDSISNIAKHPHTVTSSTTEFIESSANTVIFDSSKLQEELKSLALKHANVNSTDQQSRKKNNQTKSESLSNVNMIPSEKHRELTSPSKLPGQKTNCNHDKQSDSHSYNNEDTTFRNNTFQCTVPQSDSEETEIFSLEDCEHFPVGRKNLIVRNLSVSNINRFNSIVEDSINVLSQKSDFILEKYLDTLSKDPPNNLPDTENFVLNETPVKSVHLTAVMRSGIADNNIGQEKEITPDRKCNFSSKLQEDWGKLLLTGRCSDVVIRTREEKVHAHSFVFMVRCDKLFSCIEGVAVKQLEWDVSFKAAHLFVCYIYTGQFDMSTADQIIIEEVLSLCKKYDCEQLNQFLNQNKTLSAPVSALRRSSDKVLPVQSSLSNRCSPLKDTKISTANTPMEECDALTPVERKSINSSHEYLHDESRRPRSSGKTQNSKPKNFENLLSFCIQKETVSCTNIIDPSNIKSVGEEHDSNFPTKTNATTRSLSPDLFGEDVEEIIPTNVLEQNLSPLQHDCVHITNKFGDVAYEIKAIEGEPLKSTDGSIEGATLSDENCENTSTNINEGAAAVSSVTKTHAAIETNVVDISQSDTDASSDSLPDIPDLMTETRFAIDIGKTHNQSSINSITGISASLRQANMSDLYNKTTEGEETFNNPYVSNVWDDFDEGECHQELPIPPGNLPQRETSHAGNIMENNKENTLDATTKRDKIAESSCEIIAHKTTNLNRQDLNSTFLEPQRDVFNITSSCPISRISDSSLSERRASVRNMFSDDTLLHLQQEMAVDWDELPMIAEPANESLRTRITKDKSLTFIPVNVPSGSSRRKSTPQRATKGGRLQQLQNLNSPTCSSSDISVAITPRPDYDSMPTPEIKASVGKIWKIISLF